MEANPPREDASQFVGKASIDGVKTLTPFTKLYVSSQTIQLKAFFGTYTFHSEQVRSIEAVSSDQIYIRHAVRNYPTRISFISPGITQKLNELFFLPSADKIARTSQASDYGPYNSVFVLLYYLLWVFIVCYVYFQQGMWLAVITNLLCGFVSILLLFSKRIRLILLTPGFDFIDVVFPMIFVLVGVVLFSSWLLASPTLCTRYEHLCKPEWL